MDIEFTIPKKLPFRNIHQYKISLIETKVWRRILIPESYTFYNLHVAIQDAMGWTDSHLHCYEKRTSNQKRFTRPILLIDCTYATEEREYGASPLYDTETPITHVFQKENDSIVYVYDFGDSWEHEVVLEKIFAKDSRQTYPLCIDGKLACPPEDCGSTPGYFECIQAYKNKKDKNTLEWMGDWNPTHFDPKEIIFQNPRKRFLETME